MKNNINLNDTEMESFGNAATQHNIEKQLRSKYDKILAEKKKNALKKNSIINLASLGKVAAVVLTVVGAVFLIQNSNFSPSSQSMAQNFLDGTHIQGNPDITRKGPNSVDEIRRKANDAFVLKDFELARDKYIELSFEKKDSVLDRFYLGICHMKTKNYPNAILILSNIKAMDNNNLEEVDWLLSLAYVLSNQNENAISILDEIVSGKSYKSSQAKQLLKTIK